MNCICDKAHINWEMKHMPPLSYTSPSVKGLCRALQRLTRTNNLQLHCSTINNPLTNTPTATISPRETAHTVHWSQNESRVCRRLILYSRIGPAPEHTKPCTVEARGRIHVDPSIWNGDFMLHWCRDKTFIHAFILEIEALVRQGWFTM